MAGEHEQYKVNTLYAMTHAEMKTQNSKGESCLMNSRFIIYLILNYFPLADAHSKSFIAVDIFITSVFSDMTLYEIVIHILIS